MPSPRDEGAIVADRVGAVLGITAGPRNRVPVDAAVRVAVEIGADYAVVAAPGIVGLPRRVGGLQDDVVGLAIVAHDEGDLVDGAVDRVAVGIEALQSGKVDAGDGVSRHVPAVRHRPVAGIDRAAARRRRARLAGPWRWCSSTRRPRGPRSAVIAETEDLDLVVAARAAVDVDLEVDRAPALTLMSVAKPSITVLWGTSQYDLSARPSRIAFSCIILFILPRKSASAR